MLITDILLKMLLKHATDTNFDSKFPSHLLPIAVLYIM